MIKKLIYSIAILSMFTMCSKRTESLIVGEWIVENVGQESFPKDAQWTFYSGGRLTIKNDINVHPRDEQDGEWDAINRSVVIPYIKITGYGPRAMDGKWRVEKLTKKILVINRVEWNDGTSDGSFLRREFTRK